ncbi:nucleoside-diphosphate-sugar epimerase [Thermonema lapsum]|uniref:Nucleoside-diphosphate-sugar epimerase n=1 Tax=Thermonema lapsum TaxID=28195 RepID=A0A846MQ37_9BACT|nr:NAD(P)-binding domain-containing protein [Thermonema lapsum]NIK73684.1 nucleoside-diphosphate-sugar epimerase [Thermonema lapsum]
MSPPKSVAIVGCGWLGEALAVHCLKQGVEQVKGSSRHSERASQLQQQGIDTQVIDLPASRSHDLQQFLAADVCVFSLSPSTPGYIEALTQTCMHLPTGARLILLSATSVYPDCNNEVDEDTFIDAHNTNNPTQWQAERLVQRLVSSALIVRLGGLMGYNRFLLKYFLNKESITGADTPVNHIHRDDAVHILFRLMASDVEKGTFNAVAPMHPLKKEVLEAQARRLGITLPPQVAPYKQAFKKVIPKRLLQTLDYQFIYPNPTDFPFDLP